MEKFNFNSDNLLNPPDYCRFVDCDCDPCKFCGGKEDPESNPWGGCVHGENDKICYCDICTDCETPIDKNDKCQCEEHKKND